MKVMFFFDGKNFYESMRTFDPELRIQYQRLVEWVMQRIGATDFKGAYYYTGISENTHDVRDRFLELLERQPGFFVFRLPIKRKKTTCPHCKQEYFYFGEKQVDTQMVSDMIRLAAAGAYDIAVLCSGDSDHVPAVRAVREIGKKVFVATWGMIGVDRELLREAFDYIDLRDGVEEFQVGITDEHRAVLDELEKAEAEFADKGGFVGLSYFTQKWRSSNENFPADPTRRFKILNELIEMGKIELYDAEKAKAIRILKKRKGHRQS